jgi:hypothetical protein
VSGVGDPNLTTSLAISDEYLSTATPLPPLERPFDFDSLRRDWDVGGVLILETTGLPAAANEEASWQKVKADLIAACDEADVPVCEWPACTEEDLRCGKG